ncbi:MAG: CBS domain-containing protein [Candidatus Heimdallarchaeota archaeon]|nr:CBS domain-containing protein [Candidatus Heimdallarchaeota archaeon]
MNELAKNKSTLSKHIITTFPTESVMQVLQKIVTNNIRRIPVCDESDIIGMITTTDLLKLIGKYSFEELEVSEVGRYMSKKVISGDITDKIKDLILLIYNTGISGIPILQDEKLVSIFTNRDIIINEEIWRNIREEIISSEEGIGRLISNDNLVGSEKSIHQLIEKFNSSVQRQMIVQKGNQFLGIISHKSLIRNLFEKFQKDNLNKLDLFKMSVDSLDYLPFSQRSTPVMVSSCRMWIKSRELEAFPLFYKGFPVKLITEKDLVGYLANNLY